VLQQDKPTVTVVGVFVRFRAPLHPALSTAGTLFLSNVDIMSFFTSESLTDIRFSCGTVNFPL
jgi:hypothetical protein